MDMLSVTSLVQPQVPHYVALGFQTAETQRSKEKLPLFVQCGTNIMKVTNQPLFDKI